jgi:hypothetical protein
MGFLLRAMYYDDMKHTALFIFISLTVFYQSSLLILRWFVNYKLF